ncbi:hypothetical protein ACFV1L_33095 [Kitasatospora sp. NPDC059646]|uniref:hypothetical protein n=1 Tax=Kitasatospora sp. NPDC059646 TaxID=3346893 RepID=UPI0036BBED16
MERLQELMSGTGASRAARNLARGDTANALWGALLHGADRLRQGQELTDLEEKLVAGLRGLVGEAELKEWGRLYREAADVRGACAGVPRAISALPVLQGYSLADYLGGLPEIGEERARQSNTALVDRQAWAAGGDFDSPEFIEGMREWGFGVSVACPPEGPAGGSQAALENRGWEKVPVAMDFESFYVHREAGDGWPGGRDEIRWTSCGSSDIDKARPLLTLEVGGEDTRPGATVPIRPREVFLGMSRLGLTLDVTCWEWDTGDGNDDSIAEALHKLNDDFLASLVWELIIQLSRSELLGFLWDLTQLVLNVLSVVVKDDVSCTRTFYLSPWDLAQMSRQGSVQWHFNGDGYHELKVNVPSPIPFPKGTLEYVVHDGQSWGAPVTLPWQSISAPALVAYKQVLHALFVRPDDRAVMQTRLQDGRWSEPQRVNSWTSLLPPSVTTFQGLLYCVFPHPDSGRPQWATFDGTTWSPTTEISNCPVTLRAPALAATGDRLYLVVLDADGVDHTYTSTGSGWTLRADGSPYGTYGPVSVAWDAGGLAATEVYMAKRSDDNRVEVFRTETADSSVTWRHEETPQDWPPISCGPALTAHQLFKVWILMRAEDGTLRAATHTRSSHWGESHYVGAGGAADPIRPMDEVDAFSHGGNLYVMYRR